VLKERDMTLVVISINRDELPEHTDEEFKEWITYGIEKNAISLDNPLEELDLIATVKEIGP